MNPTTPRLAPTTPVIPPATGRGHTLPATPEPQQEIDWDGWTLYIGAMLVGFSIAYLFMMRGPGEVSSHRDPAGPAAMAAASEAKGAQALGGFGLGAGAVVLGFALLQPVTGIAVGTVIGVISFFIFRSASEAMDGFRIADSRWLAAAEVAELAGDTVPAEPHLTALEARELAATKGFETPSGSAAEVMLSIDGKLGPTERASDSVFTAMGMTMAGPTTESAPVPWASVSAAQTHENGDVTVTWDVHLVAKSTADFVKITGPLVRALRVKSLVEPGFVTNHSSGQVMGRFSNVGGMTAKPAEPDDLWEF